MRFKIGLALGLAAGYWWASTTDEQRKAQLDELVGRVRDNPRVKQVSEAVARDARRVTDAAQARVTHAAHRTADKVTVESDDATTKTTSRRAG